MTSCLKLTLSRCFSWCILQLLPVTDRKQPNVICSHTARPHQWLPVTFHAEKLHVLRFFFLCSTPATLTLSGVINLVLGFFFSLVSFLWVNSEVFKSITHYQDIELEVEFQASQLHRLSCETNAEYWFLLSISLLLFWWWLKVIFYWKKLKRLQIELFR